MYITMYDFINGYHLQNGCEGVAFECLYACIGEWKICNACVWVSWAGVVLKVDFLLLRGVNSTFHPCAAVRCVFVWDARANAGGMLHSHIFNTYIYVYVLRIAMIVGAHGWCIMKSIRRAVCYCSSDCLVNGKIDNFVRSCIKICNVLEWRCRRATTYTFTQMSWNRPCGFRLFVFGSLNLPNMHSMSMIRAHHKHNGHTMNRSIHLYDDFTLTLLPSPSIPFIVVVVFGH